MEEMREDWENCCPLCMEEMDSTDRQLKPCRCGYQVLCNEMASSPDLSLASTFEVQFSDDESFEDFVETPNECSSHNNTESRDAGGVLAGSGGGKQEVKGSLMTAGGERSKLKAEIHGVGSMVLATGGVSRRLDFL